MSLESFCFVSDNLPASVACACKEDTSFCYFSFSFNDIAAYQKKKVLQVVQLYSTLSFSLSLVYFFGLGGW